MPEDTLLTNTRMLTVAVAAEMVYQLVGANMSSPQTAELNAPARADTLSKWVTITNVKAAAWITILCIIDKSLWPAFGGALAAVEMAITYKYAINKGLSEGGQSTEKYGNGWQ